MSSNSSLSTMQRLVEQLKLEAGVERIRVSQAAAELQQYCMQNACKDALLVSTSGYLQACFALLTVINAVGIVTVHAEEEQMEAVIALLISSIGQSFEKHLKTFSVNNPVWIFVPDDNIYLLQWDLYERISQELSLVRPVSATIQGIQDS